MGGTRSVGTVPAEIEFLLGSQQRVRVLAAFEDGSRRQAGVARDLGVGRSTVHRCVEGLTAHGWVHETEGGYALTAAGERVLSAYRSFVATVERVSAHEPLFDCLEGTGVSVPPDVLGAADLVTASEHDPHAAVVACADLLRHADADGVRTAWTGVSPITNDAGEAYLTAGNDVEMIVDRRTLEASRESYFENYQLALASDRVDLQVTPDPIEVGVLLTDDRAAVTGYDDCHPTVCLHGDDAAVREWAETLYDRVRSRADRLEVRYPMPGTLDAPEGDHADPVRLD